MLMHLGFVHVFDFFDDEIGDGLPSIWVVIVIDINIVIIYDLNDF